MAAGKLDFAVGGKTLPQKNFANLNASSASRDKQLYASERRGVYLPVLRSALYEVFAAFDFASPSTSNGQRGSTLVAPQALFMMNSALMDAASRGSPSGWNAKPGATKPTRFAWHTRSLTPVRRRIRKSPLGAHSWIDMP